MTVTSPQFHMPDFLRVWAANLLPLTVSQSTDLFLLNSCLLLIGHQPLTDM